MLVQSVKASRPLLARVIRPQPRTLITATAVRRADMIQDMYLQELRKYKPTPIKPSDAEAHVQKFVAPKPPPSPEEGNIANDLKAYEEQQVEVEGRAADAAADTTAAMDDSWWFEDDEEDKTGVETVTPSGHIAH